MKWIFCICLLLTSYLANAQKPTSQSNPDIIFENYLTGVKYAEIDLSKELQKDIDKKKSYSKLFESAKLYLKQLGFEAIALTSDEKKAILSKLTSVCDITNIKFFWDYENNHYLNFGFRFYTCKEDFFEFKSEKSIADEAGTNTAIKMFNEWKSLYNKKKDYDVRFRFSLPVNPTNWEEITIKEHFDNNKLIGIEGIYEMIYPLDNIYPKYKLAIIQKKDASSPHELIYDIIYLAGGYNYNDWQEGELKGTIYKTGTPNLYTVKWYMSDKSINENTYAYIDEFGALNFQYKEGITPPTTQYIKLYPPIIEPVLSKSYRPLGTGFAISTNGIIVTNHHVIKKHNHFAIEINEFGISKRYNAKLLISDKKMDLAILKINDKAFKEFDDIPFNFKTEVSSVGESVFTLGYPLTNSMGKEIKVTDGIISARTGYQDDISSYQMTVPIQPGNSGGPLFDKKGNLIGIVHSKVKTNKAENVAYAIKSNSLLNLLGLLPEKIPLPQNTILRDKEFTEQIKLLNGFIFIISGAK